MFLEVYIFIMTNLSTICAKCWSGSSYNLGSNPV